MSTRQGFFSLYPLPSGEPESLFDPRIRTAVRSVIDAIHVEIAAAKRPTDDHVSATCHGLE